LQKRHFTIQQANEALPAVGKVVSRLQDRMGWLGSHRPEIAYMVPQFKVPDESPVDPEYFANLLEVREALGEVESLGCQIKDIHAGLVDFPARLFGKEVLLCWRVGEESIEFYHDLESGFAGRRPIPEAAVRPDGSGESTGGRHN